MLGKITKCSYGFGGYQDAQLGISFSLVGKDFGVGDFWGFWAHKPGKGASWNKTDQIKHHGEVAQRIVQLLKAANKKYVHELEGIPVEVVFDGNTLNYWRVLEEVL